MLLGSLYRRRLARRRSGAGAAVFASRRRSGGGTDVGGWRASTKPREIRGAARTGAIATRASAIATREAEAEPSAAADSPAANHAESAALPALGLDRERLAAAGFLDADSGQPLLRAQFGPIAAHVVAHAFAPDAGRRDRMILVTSAGPGEGKSFTAVNLALTLSQDEGRPVLLIDADPSTMGAARILGLASEPGLCDALDDGPTLDQVIQPTGLDNLEFLSSGKAPATMTGLLASARMARLIRELRAREAGGLVVIDGPALLAGTEAAALAMYAGQVVLVVAAGRTTAPAIEQSLGRLGQRANLWLALADGAAAVDRGSRPSARIAARR